MFVLIWLKRLLLVLIVLVLILLAPVAYTEMACRGEPTGNAYASIIDYEARRPKSRTLSTYPEWHIVHSYDDYARVLKDGDPHEFDFLPAISGFWTSFCPLKIKADEMGGMNADSKLTIYTIGLSFSIEMLARAAYEETLGRFTVWTRGPERTPLDEMTYAQAAEYAEFLKQTPWYKWDFHGARADLARAKIDVPRDHERYLAMSIEYMLKAQYADVISGAVAGIGADELRMRSVVTGLEAEELGRLPGVMPIAQRTQGIEIETERYRAFTDLVQELVAQGVEFVEIAGNDEIMYSVITEREQVEGAIYSAQRQGYGDWRHLMLVPVRELHERLQDLGDLRLEHVHDY